MNRLLKIFRIGSLAASSTLVFTLLLCAPQSHAQGTPSTVGPAPVVGNNSAPVNQIDVCNLWEADFANSVEETICILSDSGVDTDLDISAEADQDLTWYEGYPDWDGEDPNVAGLGVEVGAYDNGSAEFTQGSQVWDTGMVQGSINGGDPPEVDLGSLSSSSTVITDISNYGDWYQFEVYYSECIDPTGTGSSTCSWNGENDSGIGIWIQIQEPA